MSRRRRALALLPVLALLGLDRPPGLGDVRDVRHWSYPDYTRVVVDVSREVETEIHHLPADSGSGRPPRLYFDLPGIWVGRRYEEGIALGDGLLRRVRVGQNTLTKTRVVLDLERYERHRVFRLTHPHRVVVDVYGPREGAETLRWPRRDGMDPRGWERLPIGMRGVGTVVVDAGHGGRDPGAIGVGGLREKDVTLALARELQHLLEERGFRVVQTRTSDRTLALEERTAIAEAAGGDLFVSLHANAAPRRSVHGIETWYLDENDERHSRDVAARENGVRPDEVDALQRALADLRVREASGHSRELAATVHGSIVRGMRERYGPVPDLGVKKGPFYVLFLSQMPAILVEAGFLTHREEARRLQSPRYLRALAEEMAEGLARYREDVRVASGGGS